MRRVVYVLLLIGLAFQLVSCKPAADPRLKGAFRKPAENGWIFVHLEGEPAEVGFQHGYLLAPEIQDAQRVLPVVLKQDTKKDWSFYREAAQKVLWPHVEQEYREELQGITEGLRAKNVKVDLWDVVAANAWLELGSYYSEWYDKQNKTQSSAKAAAPEHCSAFVATGSYTKDGRVVIAHNAWTSYIEGARWNIIFDIRPARGHRILMDGFPGAIHSADDFAINSGGILITETTISRFSGWDSDGIPEFVRARKAAQYSSSIDDFARIMKEGNNGGYANTWLAADRKTNEIASLELGLKNVTLQRTKDGYFAGSNFPVNEKLIREETQFDVKDAGHGANARHVRWDRLMAEYKGKIDVAAGQRFLADHYDTFTKKEEPSERTLCGHIELSPRGAPPWQPPYGPAGAAQNKVTDAGMAEKMSMTAAFGHACGLDFRGAEHISKHPEFGWEKPYIKDVISNPWTTFQVAQ